MSFGRMNGESGCEGRLTIADLPQENVDDDEQREKCKKWMALKHNRIETKSKGIYEFAEGSSAIDEMTCLDACACEIVFDMQVW